MIFSNREKMSQNGDAIVAIWDQGLFEKTGNYSWRYEDEHGSLIVFRDSTMDRFGCFVATIIATLNGSLVELNRADVRALLKRTDDWIASSRDYKNKAVTEGLKAMAGRAGRVRE